LLDRISVTLTQALEDECAYVRAFAALGLTMVVNTWTDDHMDRVTKALQDNDPQVRHFAALGLSKFGARASKAVPNLLKLLNDERPRVRFAAVVALNKIRVQRFEDARKVFDVVLNGHNRLAKRAGRGLPGVADKWRSQLARFLAREAAFSGNERRRARATTLLRDSMVPAIAEALPILLAALRAEEASIREHAAESLGYLGSEAASLVPALRRIADDKNEKTTVRDAARLALTRIAGGG
jgi:HEAT repeat protein